MMSAGFGALLSHWRKHPLQLAMLLLGLCLATALWSGVQAINAQARSSYDRAAAMLGQDRYEQLVPVVGDEISQDVFVRLSRAGWKVSPVIEGEWRAGTNRIHLIGMDPVTLPKEAAAAAVGDASDLLAFITPPGLIYVSPSTAADLRGTNTPPLKASADLLPGTAIADIGIAQQLLGRPMLISRLIVSSDQSMGRAELATLAPEVTLKKPDRHGDISRLTDSFHLNLTAFGLLAFLVGLFIVYATIGLAFEQRRPMFRTLRTLGMPAATVMGLLIAELLIFAVVSGLLGIALGYLLASFLLPGVAATLRSLYGASVEGALAFRGGWVASGMAIAIGGTLLSAVQSLWQISRMPLLAPAQPRAWTRASQRFLAVQAGVALALLLLAAALAVWGNGLIAGFGVLACLLVGAALLLARRAGHSSRAGFASVRKSCAVVVLGGHAATDSGPGTGADGALDRAFRQCRGRHDGCEFPIHIYRLARPASRFGTLCHGALGGGGRQVGGMAWNEGYGSSSDLERKRKY